ncbi:uncharacterized protein ACIQIH_006716 isoform 2-T2 [Cyanocitta cristata]
MRRRLGLCPLVLSLFAWEKRLALTWLQPSFRQEANVQVSAPAVAGAQCRTKVDSDQALSLAQMVFLAVGEEECSERLGRLLLSMDWNMQKEDEKEQVLRILEKGNQRKEIHLGLVGCCSSSNRDKEM